MDRGLLYGVVVPKVHLFWYVIGYGQATIHEKSSNATYIYNHGSQTVGLIVMAIYLWAEIVRRI